MGKNDTKASLVLHIDNALDKNRQNEIEQIIRENQGVHSAWFCINRPHLMIVEYDASRVSFGEIIKNVSGQSLHVQRIA